MSEAKPTITQSTAMHGEEQLRGLMRTGVAHMDMFVLAFEVCRNERLLKGMGESLIQYVVLLCLFG
jgi:hypothetical protein